MSSPPPSPPPGSSNRVVLNEGPDWEAARELLHGLGLPVQAAPSFASGAAAIAPSQAVALAVMRSDGGLAHADPTFLAWFPGPAQRSDLVELIARAQRSGGVIGRLQPQDGAPVAAWAGPTEAAAGWPLPVEAQAALGARGRTLVLVFAPSRSSELATRAGEAFGLSPQEARLAEALLSAPTLEVAAAQIGIGRETARDTLKRLLPKVGGRRAHDVVHRMLDLMCAVHGRGDLDPELLGPALGLSPAEVRAAVAVAGGATHGEAADALGLKAETVRGYVRSALAKTGLARARDLSRLFAETQALSQLVGVAEPVFTGAGSAGRLRIVAAASERRVAFLDYGPVSGRPIFVFHGFIAGRSLPPALIRILQAEGWRPLAPQRPGFGLTEPATGDYLATAASDLAALVETLKLREVAILARDGGVAAALAFAAAHPDRVSQGLLLNPRPPAGPQGRESLVLSLARTLMRNPHLLGSLGELMRRQTRTDLVEAQLRRALQWPADRAALEDAAVRRQLVRDIQAQFAHSSAGFAAEHALYGRGWTPPLVNGTGPWTVLSGEGFGEEPPRTPWLDLPEVQFTRIEGAGVLAPFTHPEALLAPLIAGSGRG